MVWKPVVSWVRLGYLGGVIGSAIQVGVCVGPSFGSTPRFVRISIDRLLIASVRVCLFGPRDRLPWVSTTFVETLFPGLTMR